MHQSWAKHYFSAHPSGDKSGDSDISGEMMSNPGPNSSDWNSGDSWSDSGYSSGGRYNAGGYYKEGSNSGSYYVVESEWYEWVSTGDTSGDTSDDHESSNDNVKANDNEGKERADSSDGV